MQIEFNPAAERNLYDIQIEFNPAAERNLCDIQTEFNPAAERNLCDIQIEFNPAADLVFTVRIPQLTTKQNSLHDSPFYFRPV